MNELQNLRERISKEGADTSVQKLVSLLESLKALERQESEFQSNCNAEHSGFEADVVDLEKKIRTGFDIKSLSDGLNDALSESLMQLNSAKRFQDAITSSAGRMKLIDSMEGIVKGSQQKLEKVQLGLQEEQKVCDALKQRYAAAIMEQRCCYFLLKAFQEECAKNERLWSRSSV